MLSIKVAEVGRTRVGLSIEGKREQLWRDDRKSRDYTKMMRILEGQCWSPPWLQCVSQRTQILQ